MLNVLPALVAAAAFFSVLDVVCASPSVVGYSFTKKQVRDVSASQRLRRRQSVVETPLTNADILYYMNITIGTPGQPVAVQVDTGSSDLWVPSLASNICENNRAGCSNLGGFNPRRSSTFKNVVSNAFDISYVSGDQILGDYVRDTVNIGNTAIKALTMGLATGGSARTPIQGIMGIGYSKGEAIVQQNPAAEYPNIVNELKNQGFIKSLSYSIWLNDLSSDQGNILFGGIDTKKFVGSLSVLPVQLNAVTRQYDTFTVALSGISFSSSGQEAPISIGSRALPVILDSGTTLTLLPDQVATQIFDGIGVLSTESYGNVIPCNTDVRDAKFSFQFGGRSGPTIQVGLDEFITPLVLIDGSEAPSFDSGAKACSFGIMAAGNKPLLFGDTFMRSAYVVYDLENNQIGIAQTNFNTTESDIQEIGSNVPSANTITGVTAQQTASMIRLGDATITGAAGGILTATGRTGTFGLGGSTASPTGSRAAASGIRAPNAEVAWLVTCGVATMAFLFGGSMFFYL